MARFGPQPENAGNNQPSTLYSVGHSPSRHYLWSLPKKTGSIFLLSCLKFSLFQSLMISTNKIVLSARRNNTDTGLLAHHDACQHNRLPLLTPPGRLSPYC